MRRKHTNKKHRILTLAQQKIPNQLSSHSILDQEYLTQLDHQNQETLQAKDYEHFTPQTVLTPNQNPQPNFKECKIRQFLSTQNYSPTHSDIQYIDTMQNYKTYLNKTQTSKANQNQSKPQCKSKPKTKTTNQSKSDRRLTTWISPQKNQQLNIIQQKIHKIKTLQSKYNSHQQFTKIYGQIEQNKLQEKDSKQNESFCLMSVAQYLSFSQSFQNLIGNVRNKNLSKFVCYKAAKRPLSQQAKKWYCPKAYRTERDIDPEGLIKTVTLDKWKQKKNQGRKLKQPEVQELKININSHQHQHQHCDKKPHSKSKQRNRPFTAPNKIIKQRCRTEEILISTAQPYTEEVISKTLNSTKFDTSAVTTLRKKMKGVRYLGRQKLTWEDFKDESERCRMMKSSIGSRTQQVFEYPWNWIKNQNSPNIHAKIWKS